MGSKRLFAGALVLALDFATSGAQVSTSISLRVDSAVRVAVQHGFSGAVLVSRGDTIIVDKAYGAERGTPVQTTGRFWIASGAKQFTSAAILKCQEKGRLSLDDPIGRFIPNAPPDKRAITIRQLLAHTSGLGQSYVSEGVNDRETAVARMLAEPLAGSPGSGFRYSNNNYQLAVAIVELASGRPYREFVRQELWIPVGMDATGFAGEPGAHHTAPARNDLPPRLSRAYWGGEGVFSSTHDLFKWFRALRSSGVLSTSSIAALFTPVTAIQEGAAALGWFVGKSERGSTRIFTRGNEDFGANALVYAYPESDVMIIVLTHAGSADSNVSWSRLMHSRIEGILLP